MPITPDDLLKAFERMYTQKKCLPEGRIILVHRNDWRHKMLQELILGAAKRNGKHVYVCSEPLINMGELAFQNEPPSFGEPVQETFTMEIADGH